MAHDIDALLKWLGTLLCRMGIHSYKVIDVTYEIGPAGNVERLECRRCGMTYTRRA